MLIATCRLIGASPLCQSRPIDPLLEKKKTGETGDAFEERTWRQRIHSNEDGFVIIPGQALKNCLSEVAKFLGESVPGKGKSTYTKHFVAGILVPDPMVLSIKAADVQGQRLFLPSDGIRGSGKRVWKRIPTIQKWEASASIYVFDPVLIDKPEKIHEYLVHAGKFIGLGTFRPINNGYCGRFSVADFKTQEGA